MQETAKHAPVRKANTKYRLAPGQTRNMPKINRPDSGLFQIWIVDENNARHDYLWPRRADMIWTDKEWVSKLSKWRRQILSRVGGATGPSRDKWTRLEIQRLGDILDEMLYTRNSMAAEDWDLAADALNVALENTCQKKGDPLAVSISGNNLTSGGKLRQGRVGSRRTGLGCRNQANKTPELMRKLGEKTRGGAHILVKLEKLGITSSPNIPLPIPASVHGVQLTLDKPEPVTDSSSTEDANSSSTECQSEKRVQAQNQASDANERSHEESHKVISLLDTETDTRNVLTNGTKINAVAKVGKLTIAFSEVEYFLPANTSGASFSSNSGDVTYVPLPLSDAPRRRSVSLAEKLVNLRQEGHERHERECLAREAEAMRLEEEAGSKAK
jgi:hypothetical protein